MGLMYWILKETEKVKQFEYQKRSEKKLVEPWHLDSRKAMERSLEKLFENQRDFE